MPKAGACAAGRQPDKKLQTPVSCASSLVILLAGFLAVLPACGGSSGTDGPPNAAPDPSAPAIVVAQNATGTSRIDPGDPDAGQGHTFRILQAPANGDASVAPDGTVTFTARPGFVGEDRLVVAVTDSGEPPLQAEAAVDVRVPGPNILFVITDDQRWDTLWAMPILQERLLANGVQFTNAFVTNPVCCPVRASILSGGYLSHDTGVLTGSPPNGGAPMFIDANTLPVHLQGAGYQTALVGKYLNGYHLIDPYVPPGWDRFVASIDFPNGWSSYYVASGSSGREPSMGTLEGPYTDYLTDFQRDRALEFLDACTDAPFFLYFSTDAPHDPATPAPEDAGKFADFVYRDRAYGEADLSDKPLWARNNAAPFSEFFASLEEEDEFHRDQLRSLQAVDRALGALLDRVEALGKRDSTLVVFTSDNGYLWGEHGLFSKAKPYEESIRVPLVVSAPWVEPAQRSEMVAADLDLSATFYASTLAPGGTGGLSLLPLLEDSPTVWRDTLLLERFENYPPKIWSALRVLTAAEDLKYVEYGTGEAELYDLATDPFEERSLHADPARQPRIAELADVLAASRGLTINTWPAPAAAVGVPYTFTIGTWGGVRPFAWDLVAGSLPAEMLLDPASGEIRGTPGEAGTFSVRVRVRDSSVSPQTGHPQSYLKDLTITVK